MDRSIFWYFFFSSIELVEGEISCALNFVRISEVSVGFRVFVLFFCRIVGIDIRG